MGSVFAHGPRAGVGREVTVTVALSLEVCFRRHEVLGFLPVATIAQSPVKRFWHARKTPDAIECKIDRVEFNDAQSTA
jgi:hypothetical protein